MVIGAATPATGCRSRQLGLPLSNHSEQGLSRIGVTLYKFMSVKRRMASSLSHSTPFVMVCAPAIKLAEIDDNYGFRTWIEYGFKQAKDVLGWADFRMTRYQQIEKWWEMVMSASVRI
jgi:hypothetical protein